MVWNSSRLDLFVGPENEGTEDWARVKCISWNFEPVRKQQGRSSRMGAHLECHRALSLQAPAFGGTVSHQGCFLRFMSRGLISNGPFSSREDITVKPIFYSISPALLWCLMLLRFRLEGQSLDCSSSICFYFLYCTTYLALSDITQFCFSGLAPKSFSPALLCLVLVLF